MPMPTALYSCLPLFVKRLLLFELPMYETDWSWTPELGGDDPAAVAVEKKNSDAGQRKSFSADGAHI